MSDERRHICLGFTDERYPEGTHICYLYNDDEERRRILPLFARHALLEDERLEYLADVSGAEDFPRILAELGLVHGRRDLADQVALTTTREGYYPEGEFRPHTTLALIRESYRKAISAGLSGARITGEMEWVLRGIPGAERIIEFEARINDLVEETPITVMCQYDLRQFDGATMFDIMSVHPVMVVGGHILHNPFYRHPPAPHGHPPGP
ncbi:MEDS domain-containing protein [Massilia sp. UMI-21]|nr:MEDS domain-containing protein [Massilia sp. UMI-21]